jgi:hypothetical protein
VVSLLQPEPVSTPLSSAEKERFRELELIVDSKLTVFIQCGRALLEIREKKLWRGRYDSFAAYARERFGLCHSTANQICRSTQVYETLSATLADSDTPVRETVAEITLRPLVTLPSPELQKETWRLAANLSPDKQPTRTITARVARMVTEAVDGPKPAKGPAKESDVMFVRPIQRLSRIPSFNPQVACLHVKTPEQARAIVGACETVVSRCAQISSHLNRQFPDVHLDCQTSSAY